MSVAAHPYANLTPDRVLDALASVGLNGDGRMQALGSYENRVYQIGVEDAPPIVVKFYRPARWDDAAILEEHAFAAELAACEIPVVAPMSLATRTLHTFEGFRFAAYPRCGGRAPELSDRSTLEWMGRFLGRIHAVGALAPFRARPRISVETFGVQPRDWLLAHDFIPPDLVDAWRSIAALALDSARGCFDRAGDVRSLRLHGDCHSGNVLWIEHGAMHGPHFVDFDDARMGPAVQDLWMLLSGDRADMTRQLDAVLTGYREFHDFDLRELNLVEALRTLRLLHYSAWIAQRWDDPAFPVAFPWFNTQRYWQDRILELREQVALMDEPPLEMS
ncbi:MAG TPA: serine/threonine protein kinase [Casimicrobiaceae bacterium]|nr:serine/threonine protein kinase [Casimicrobiaceae bacterium]